MSESTTSDPGPRHRNVLITGGAGFIGSALAARLRTTNTVTILDDLSTGTRANLAECSPDQVIVGDVTDPDCVRDAVAGQDVVVHLAAMMGVRRTLENPLGVLEVNIDGTRTVLEAAADAGVDRVVVASTSEVYGDVRTPPYAEGDDAAPKTNYAVAKLADERFAQAYASQYDVEYTILRYFNVYGPRQDGSPYGYVVPIFVSKALAGEPLTVHGTGEQTRDFTHIRDAVDCTIRAMGPAGRDGIFNVGTGTETSIAALAETVVDVVGAGEVTHAEHPRPYTVERRCADVSNARERLGYEPEIPLREGIQSFLESNAGRTEPPAPGTGTERRRDR